MSYTVERRLLIAIFVMVLMVFLSQLVSFAVRSSISNEASWCRDSGGIYIRLANNNYDCVGETPSVVHTR